MRRRRASSSVSSTAYLLTSVERRGSPDFLPAFFAGGASFRCVESSSFPRRSRRAYRRTKFSCSVLVQRCGWPVRSPATRATADRCGRPPAHVPTGSLALHPGSGARSAGPGTRTPPTPPARARAERRRATHPVARCYTRWGALRGPTRPPREPTRGLGAGTVACAHRDRQRPGAPSVSLPRRAPRP